MKIFPLTGRFICWISRTSNIEQRIVSQFIKALVAIFIRKRGRKGEPVPRIPVKQMQPKVVNAQRSCPWSVDISIKETVGAPRGTD